MREIYKRINEVHEEDPVIEKSKEGFLPRELLYSNRMVRKLEELLPEHDTVLDIAVRCHHLGRWEVDRSEYPEGKAGYYMWRKSVYEHQAGKAEAIMNEFNIEEDIRNKVLKMIKKEDMKVDKLVQTVEDLACIVFVENYLESFSKKHEDEKILVILRKTMAKLSDRGREWLSQSKFSENIEALISQV